MHCTKVCISRVSYCIVDNDFENNVQNLEHNSTKVMGNSK